MVSTLVLIHFGSSRLGHTIQTYLSLSSFNYLFIDSFFLNLCINFFGVIYLVNS